MATGRRCASTEVSSQASAPKSRAAAAKVTSDFLNMGIDSLLDWSASVPLAVSGQARRLRSSHFVFKNGAVNGAQDTRS
jgi:hypothetical protein